MNRQKAVSDRLVALAAELRTLVGRIATQEVVWHCHDVFRKRPIEAFRELGLQSSYKQCWYLLGVLLGTPEPSQPRHLDEEGWTRVHHQLQDVIDTYHALFLLSAEESLRLTEAERARYAVAVPEFIRYFNNGVLASAEQMITRAEAYLTPFNGSLQELVGFSGTDALQMASWVTARIQDRWDRLHESARLMRELFERSQREGWSFERSRQEASVLANAQQGGLELPDPLIIDRAGLEEAFGLERARAFWEFFVSRRGQYPDFTYFTEANPAEDRPLIGIDEGFAMCPIANALIVAIVRRLSETLKNAEPTRTRFLRRRDAVLEETLERLFSTFFGPEAEIFRSVRETAKGLYEHDLIVIWRRRVLIVEAKASPPVEPFRDVERAFTRIRDSFRSKAGIQKAYEQTARITRPLRNHRKVELYDQQGRLVRTITPDEVDVVFGVCVTADDYGVLATDLSLLLEKSDEDAYPWAVNAFDLEALLEGFALKGWDPEKFFAYLASRSKLHGHAHPSDELELAGMFLRHARLPEPRPDIELWIDPEYAHIFDEIYMH